MAPCEFLSADASPMVVLEKESKHEKELNELRTMNLQLTDQVSELQEVLALNQDEIDELNTTNEDLQQKSCRKQEANDKLRRKQLDEIAEKREANDKLKNDHARQCERIEQLMTKLGNLSTRNVNKREKRSVYQKYEKLSEKNKEIMEYNGIME